MYIIKDKSSLERFNLLKSYDDINRIRVINYDSIPGLNLTRFPPNHDLTLEFIDSRITLEDIIDKVNVGNGMLTTIRIKYTREYQKPIEPLKLKSYKIIPCERLIIDFGVRIDCTFLEVQQLVLYNMLSAVNLDKAMAISTLVIVHSYNVADDNIDNKTFDLPQPSGLNLLIIPESQEFNYTIRDSKLPDIIGILPSSYYPSRFAVGVQHAREPISISNIPEIVYEVYSETNN